MKKICFVTAARSEYGLLKWIMKDVDACPDMSLQLIVTGGHLLAEQGHTVDDIIADGFKIDETVDAHLDTSSDENIAASMGRMAQMFAATFSRLKPDILMVLGDRYELLPICNTAYVMHIPIAHISGGDVTAGAIDDGIRNAVTMLATYHFPGTEDSAANIRRMRGNSDNIWVVGEPGLDAFNRVTMMTRDELAENLNIDAGKKWVLMTYHPETRESLAYNIDAANNIINALDEYDDIQVVMTYANADVGGQEINKILCQTAKKNKKFIVIPSLGQRRYLSFMKQTVLVIGNSSSGIVETPILGITSINVGKRQFGRHICANVIPVSVELESIIAGLTEAFSNMQNNRVFDSFWGNGNTAQKVVGIVQKL
jgi:UDP-hydrolysing UDP-N-acetyl-D-glucosamine 2-epimerase